MLEHEEAAYLDYLEQNGLLPAYEAWLENKEDEQ